MTRAGSGGTTCVHGASQTRAGLARSRARPEACLPCKTPSGRSELPRRRDAMCRTQAAETRRVARRILRSLIRTFKFKSRLRSSLLEASLFCSGPSPRRPWPRLGVSPPLSLLQPCPVPGDLSRLGARAPALARAPPAAHRAHPSLRSGLAPGAGRTHRLPRRPWAAPLLPLLLRCPRWRPVPPAALRERLSVWPPSGFRARAEAAHCSVLCGVFGARSSVRGMSRVLDA